MALPKGYGYVQGQNTRNTIRIFRYVWGSAFLHPREGFMHIDYRRGLAVGLTEVVTKQNGRATRIDYEDPDNGDLIVREDYAYGPSKRTLTITWYTEKNEAWPETKTVETYYSNREEVVREIFSLLREHGGGTEAQNRTARRSLLSTHKDDFDDFILSGDQQIVASIQNDATHGWLDNQVAGQSIRQHIIDRLQAA